MSIEITNSSAGHFEFTTEKNPGNIFILSQMSNVGHYFEKFLIEEQFDTIVEIGTYKGGLSILLDEIKQKHGLSFKLHTLDIGMWDEVEFRKVLEVFNSREIAFKKLDIFSDPGNAFVASLIEEKGKKVCILCDGGDKVKEFVHFSKLIKPGDFIMAHDYSHNSNNEDGMSYNCSWNWQEIYYTDIVEAIRDNKLEINSSVRFPEVAWACYKKAL